MFRSLILLLAAFMAPCHAATAQVTRVGPGGPRVPMVNDSMVVELIGQAIVEKSSDLVERAQREGTQIPIEISLPAGATSYQWQMFLDRLMQSLRGRHLQTPDNLQWFIDASAVSFSRDTIRAVIDVGLRSRCRRGWILDGYSHAVMWTRQDSSEEWVLVEPERQTAYDSFGCPVEPR